MGNGVVHLQLRFDDSAYTLSLYAPQLCAHMCFAMLYGIVSPRATNKPDTAFVNETINLVDAITTLQIKIPSLVQFNTPCLCSCTQSLLPLTHT